MTCTHSYHDEIFNFTGADRTNTEINVHLLDNTKDYMTKKTRWKMYKITDKRRGLTPIIKGNFTVSVKYEMYSKT